MATRKLRIGFLGAGYIADWHAQAVAAVPNAVLAAVCDQSRDRAEAFAARYQVPAVFVDLGVMLAAGSIDAVHVLLPPAAHAAAAARILAAGLPVYIEKPMCLTPEECQNLESRTADGPALAVGHNFLFDSRYEALKSDLEAGRLGRVEHVTIVWAKEFSVARTGPFSMWALRHPANILLEVGPHSVAHLLHLVGPPDRLDAESLDPVLLPGGVKFFRRWLIRSRHAKVTADIRLSLGPGFPEHRLEVHGSAGTAVVDFEAGTYILRRRSHLPTDFDRYYRNTGEARRLVRQARRNLLRYVLSKAKLVPNGNLFGASIARAVSQFYANLPHVTDSRLSASFASQVVRTCLDAARYAGFDPDERPSLTKAVSTQTVSVPARRPEVLVLGGTGFLGRALLRRLVADGRVARVLVRDRASVPDDLRSSDMELVQGDLRNTQDLVRALDSVPAVIHVARSQSRTWDDYQRDEIGLTRSLAEACIAAGVRRFVYTGTTDSYYSGRAGETITEATPLDPKIHRRNLYARAKAESERILDGLRMSRELPVVVARPAVVIGSNGVPHHWGVGMWTSPDACLFWGDGTNPVPFVLVDDVADALIRCVDTPGIEGETFNLAADPCLSARDYVAELGAVTGTWIDARPISPWRFFATDLGKWAVKCLVRHPERRVPSLRDWKSRTYLARFDCGKAKDRLGWRPRSDRDTLLAEGIRRPAEEWAS